LSTQASFSSGDAVFGFGENNLKICYCNEMTSHIIVNQIILSLKYSRGIRSQLLFVPNLDVSVKFGGFREADVIHHTSSSKTGAVDKKLI
jgi:hypothetical protein